MSDLPAYFEQRYAADLMLAIEVMSAIVEGYDHSGQHPDTTLADYITNQTTGPDTLWRALSGFATLTFALLMETDEPKQAHLDRFADAAQKMTPKKDQPPRQPA
ncbi:hypothetical protein PJI20_10065 [Mycobacterium kansasii]